MPTRHDWTRQAKLPSVRPQECMYVCMCVCMYVCMYVFACDACMYVRECVHMFCFMMHVCMCIRVFMHACLDVHIYIIYIFISMYGIHACMCMSLTGIQTSRQVKPCTQRRVCVAGNCKRVHAHTISLVLAVLELYLLRRGNLHSAPSAAAPLSSSSAPHR